MVVADSKQPDDVPPLLLLKSAAPHAGKNLDAMKATATALKERSLDMFKTALKDYQERESSSCFLLFVIVGQLTLGHWARTPTRSIDPVTSFVIIRYTSRTESRTSH